MPTRLDTASAAELAALYRSGAASPVEAVRAAIDRIGRWEPQLHALARFEPDAALAAARASEARWRRGAPLSALDGVPCTLKENIATRGVPTPLGSAAGSLDPATDDAPPAARLREAGAVRLGKTTMPDLGMLSSGISSLHPTTRNPWHLSKNPGGSSAGAAAAAAAGYAPLHVGTDIGGSIRLPAAWCGVFGFKPSGGRVPIHPAYTGRVAGPICRSVVDAALAMAVLSRPDGRDATSLPPSALDWPGVADARPDALRGLKVGLLRDAGWGSAAGPAVLAAVDAAAAVLAGAGAAVEPLAPFTTRAMADGIDRFWRMRAWLELAALPAERRGRVLAYLLAWAESAAGLTAPELFHAQAQMAALRDAAVAASQPYDLLLSPVSPAPAFAAERASPLDDPSRPFEHIAFTLPFNMSEQPAASLPWTLSPDGLPIGVQLAGRRHDDLGVLRAARALEVLRPPQPAWPEPAP